jgi:di/tricarboxylate transporter
MEPLYLKHGAGNYRFVDFVKIGVPLTLVAMMVTILLVPILLQIAS